MLSILDICISSEERENRQRSIQIDRKIEQDLLRQQRECKLLLLGEWNIISCPASHFIDHTTVVETREWRIRQIDHCQANEDHTSEWIHSR